jgi:hypothetical protein
MYTPSFTEPLLRESTPSLPSAPRSGLLLSPTSVTAKLLQKSKALGSSLARLKDKTTKLLHDTHTNYQIDREQRAQKTRERHAANLQRWQRREEHLKTAIERRKNRGNNSSSSQGGKAWKPARDGTDANKAAERMEEKTARKMRAAMVVQPGWYYVTPLLI